MTLRDYVKFFFIGACIGYFLCLQGDLPPFITVIGFGLGISLLSGIGYNKSLAAVKRNGLQLQVSSFKWNKEVVMAAVKQNGLSLYHADSDLKSNVEIVMAAVNQDGRALQYADSNLKNNIEIVMAAVNQNGLSLQHANFHLKSNAEIVMAAVNQSGLALKHAEEFSKQAALVAVNQNGLALQYVGFGWGHSRKIVKAAVNQNGLALQYAGCFFMQTDVILAAVKQNSAALRYAGFFHLHDETFLTQCAQENPLVVNLDTSEYFTDINLRASLGGHLKTPNYDNAIHFAQNYSDIHPLVLNQSRYDMVLMGFVSLNKASDKDKNVNDWLVRLESIGKSISTGINYNIFQVVASYLNANEGGNLCRAIVGNRELRSCEAVGLENSVVRQ